MAIIIEGVDIKTDCGFILLLGVQLDVNIQCTYVQTYLSQQLLNEEKQHPTQMFKQQAEESTIVQA